ncbi:TPM domain-containing protein [Shimia sp.]|uniref:TPM domain-containing protein n=1 Tax=Shimia sp. TaxID=1954381 RepID=UPI003297CEC9
MRAFLRILTVVFLATATVVQGQTYPDYQELFVNDFADLLNDEEEQGIRTKLERLRTESGIEFTVVTIPLMSDFDHNGAIEPFATGLFNYWGVGDATRNDGVLMLVSRFDRKMRIEVGSGYASSKDAPMKAIIDDEILPRFRDDDYVRGIQDGVTAVILNLTGSLPGEQGMNGFQKFLAKIKRGIDALGEWLLLILAPLLAIPAQLYRRWQRNKPRICPTDGARMTRLSEQWEDSHLQQGQITEERLKSVDYDVWECPKCDHQTVEGYRAWFSQYGACRSCGFRTVEGDTTIITSATTSSTGLKRIDYQCHHCHNTWSATRTIPKKSSSSSSSSSSFGGGSSSGGGASGSW